MEDQSGLEPSRQGNRPEDGKELATLESGRGRGTAEAAADEDYQSRADPRPASGAATAESNDSGTSRCGQRRRPPEAYSTAQLRDQTYLDLVKGGTHKLGKACVQIVGAYNVGKSGVFHSLTEKPVDSAHDTAWGIDVGDVSCANGSSGNLVWRRGRPTFRWLFWELLPNKIKAIWYFGIFFFLTDLLQSWYRRWQGEEPAERSSVAEPDQELVLKRVEEMLSCSESESTDLQNPSLHIVVYDFRGYWEYYMMQQMFLSRHTVYILVIDGTKDLDADSTASTRENMALKKVSSFIPQTQRMSIDFWLKAIHSRTVAERADDRKASPKVVLVVTKADVMKRKSGGNDNSINDYKNQLTEHLRGNPCDYHNLVHGEPIFVDNKNYTSDEGVRELRSTVYKLITDSQSNDETTYPTRHALLLELIRQGKFEKDLCKMSFSKFEKLSRFILNTQDDARNFVTRHHACGELLHIQLKDQELVITDPQQLMTKLSPIFMPRKLGSSDIEVTTARRLDTRGKVSQKSLTQVFGNDEEYQNLLIAYGFIVQMGRTTDGQSEYLVPSLLEPIPEQRMPSGPTVAPPIGFTFYSSDTQNPYIPPGLFSRLVSRCLTSKWELSGKVYYDFAQFKFSNGKDADILISLQQTQEAIKLLAHKTEIPCSSEDGIIIDLPEDSANRILTAVKDGVLENLVLLTKEVLPWLEGRLKTILWCNEPVSSNNQETKPLVELKETLENTLFCDNHEDRQAHNIQTLKYQPWFCGTEDPKLSEERLLVFEVKKDPCPQQTLKKYGGKVYDLIHKNRGLCLIVNMLIFEPAQSGLHLERRDGSVFDQVNLECLFKQLGFKVEVHQDLCASKLKNLLESVAKRQDHGDAFFLWIMSHGLQESVYSSDGKTVTFSEIQECFNGEECLRLIEKPKVLFFVCCQGNKQAKLLTQSPSDPEDITSEERPPAVRDHGHRSRRLDSEGTHPAGDTLVVHSTIEGYTSNRDPHRGTWFVRAFVKEMCKSAHNKHLEEILEDVNECLRQNAEQGELQQATWKNCAFRKKLFFLPGYFEDK